MLSGTYARTAAFPYSKNKEEQMVYYTVADALSDYLLRYELKIAIVKAQRARHQAKTEHKFNFWSAVENELKALRPKKTPKYLRNKE